MIRMSWAAQTASIEETLALWAASLREIKQRIRPLFTQERVATNAGLFVEGCFNEAGLTRPSAIKTSFEPGVGQMCLPPTLQSSRRRALPPDERWTGGGWPFMARGGRSAGQPASRDLRGSSSDFGVGRIEGATY